MQMGPGVAPVTAALVMQMMGPGIAPLAAPLPPLHQQKSTFLIPSYSILLHLIPLILGVRRE